MARAHHYLTNSLNRFKKFQPEPKLRLFENPRQIQQNVQCNCAAITTRDARAALEPSTFARANSRAHSDAL